MSDSITAGTITLTTHKPNNPPQTITISISATQIGVKPDALAALRAAILQWKSDYGITGSVTGP